MKAELWRWSLMQSHSGHLSITLPHFESADPYHNQVLSFLVEAVLCSSCWEWHHIFYIPTCFTISKSKETYGHNSPVREIICMNLSTLISTRIWSKRNNKPIIWKWGNLLSFSFLSESKAFISTMKLAFYYDTKQIKIIKAAQKIISYK